MRMIKSLLEDETGIEIAEYALAAALIVIVAALAFTNLGVTILNRIATLRSYFD
jgi:Flp pilus assembly pilin Flp